MINIEDMTLKQVREIQNLVGHNQQQGAGHPWKLEEYYVIRTVTMIQYGKLKAVYPQELVMEDCSWIADTARFHDFLKDPTKCNECEPFTDDVVIGRGSIIDAQIVSKVKMSQK